ncbi:alpha/beta hydrolase [Nocardia neocaledoniensis]|uniref:alpha/beta hydrolase n=1 Tax=Nocardia neocaledoniensis TaxID=236511 RepID=UPI00245718CC|nr:alpha/beta hydrolase [Nocardia neocaledoniensis]
MIGSPSKMSGVDPALRHVARFLPTGSALHRGLTVPRVIMGLAGRIGELPRISIARVNPDVTVRIHRPAGRAGSGPALLWIHGGGTVMGSAAQEDKHCRRLADHCDITVVAVDHRLAPEHPYPTPLLDCYEALRWLARQSWIDPARIAIGGASAGGGLTAALALLARERADITPVLQLMTYPMLDDRTGTTPDSRARIMWSGQDNQIAWRCYLNGSDPAHASPARRTDLEGLPTAWIGVGTLDLFYPESVAYGERLRAANVPTHTEIATGAFHAFDMIAPNAPVSQRFFASQCHALRTALAP